MWNSTLPNPGGMLPPELCKAIALAQPLDDTTCSHLPLPWPFSHFGNDDFIGTTKKKSKWIQDLPPRPWIASYLAVVFVRLLKISSRMIHCSLWKLSDSTLFRCLTEATYILCHFLQRLSSMLRLMQLEHFAEIVNHPCNWLQLGSCLAWELFMWLPSIAFINWYCFIGC